jgi:hypothetical protein
MDAERVTLTEGIARAGGTVDAVGNLSAIYLMRSEPTSRARSIMAADRLPSTAASWRLTRGAPWPARRSA